jgi:serine/threonine protein kinase
MGSILRKKLADSIQAASDSGSESSDDDNINYEYNQTPEFPLLLSKTAAQGGVAVMHKEAFKHLDKLDEHDAVDVYYLSTDPSTNHPEIGTQKRTFKVFKRPHAATDIAEIAQKILRKADASSEGRKKENRCAHTADGKNCLEVIINYGHALRAQQRQLDDIQREISHFKRINNPPQDGAILYSAKRKVDIIDEHWNIPAQYHSLSANEIGFYLFSMPFYQGMDVQDITHLTLNTFVNLMKKMLNAVAHMHKQGIAHGDLTPKNVRLYFPEKTLALSADHKQNKTQHLDDAEIKIIDFGNSTDDFNCPMQLVGHTKVVMLVANYLLERKRFRNYMGCETQFSKVTCQGSNCS